MIKLKPSVGLAVSYSDRTPFGSPVTNRPDELSKAIFAPLMRQMGLRGIHPTNFRDPSTVLDEIRSSVLFHSIAEICSEGWTLRDAVLFPPSSAAEPNALILTDGVQTTGIRLSAHEWPDLHELVSCLSTDGVSEGDVKHLSALCRDILDQLFIKEFVEHQAPTIVSPMLRPDVTFIGHNAVLLRSGETCVAFDPYLREHSHQYPKTYQPLSRSDIGNVDCIFITHSHRDHFDLPSLLRFSPKTPIYVPIVARESLLSIDMAHRLSEIGFTDIRPVGWGDVTQVGDLVIHAMPFFGEQPTDHSWLHGAVRNEGATYMVRSPQWSVVLLADSGFDSKGSVKTLAMDMRRRLGPVDYLFIGYRGWSTYPPQLLGSSVARYMLFVPPFYWSTRMQLMCSIDEALDVAEQWGASFLCPYGDGGAPWFWDIGLGPRLDERSSENPKFDPFPERVVEASLARSITADGVPIGSSSTVLLLRPGDALHHVNGGLPRQDRMAGHSWPYVDQ